MWTLAQRAAGSEQPGRQAAEQPSHPWLQEVTTLDHTLAPTHQIAFDGTYFYGVEFSRDGRTVYCLVTGQSIDLWAAGLSHWPWALGAVVALCVLVYLFVLLRIRRYPQVRREPHCRRCNYNLISQVPLAIAPKAQRQAPPPETRCPECGVLLAKRRPRRGRTIRRRLLTPTVLLLGIVGLAAWLSLARGSPLRGAGASMTGIGVWSEAVDRLADEYELEWLLKHRTPVTHIEIIDAQKGQRTGRLRSFRGPAFGGMRLSPDGSFLAVCDQSSHIRWVRASNGRVKASTSGGVFESGPEQSPAVVGFDGPASDPWVYYAAAHPTEAVSRLYRWRPRTNEQEVVVEEPTYVRTYNNGATKPIVRRYRLLRRPDGLSTVSAPSFSQAYGENKYEMVVRAPMEQRGGVERTIPVADRNISMSTLVVSPRSATAYLSRRLGIVRIDLASGQPGYFSSGGVLWQHLCISEDARYLAAADHRGTVVLFDTLRERWIAQLRHDPSYIAPELYISPDGRWLAATPTKSLGNAMGPYKTDLFLFDLSPILNDAK